jgi:hypothetical protein
MTLQIGDTAPDFEAMTTEGRIRFHDWIGESWAVLLEALCASIRREAIFLLHLATAARSAPLTPQAIGMIAAQYGGVRFV